MSTPKPTLTPVTRPYWEALAEGRLTFQRCEDCGQGWLPAREACPSCLSNRSIREEASGTGRIVSWVVYHTAYAEHLAARVPYNVSIVELDEGPRLLTSIIDCDFTSQISIDARVRLKITEEGGLALPHFVLCQDED
jgi:uncharacterized OB-fold protein